MALDEEIYMSVSRKSIMTKRDLELLKANIDKVVKIVSNDGETMLAMIHAISDEDQDVIYDLISTTKPSQYEKHDKRPAYLIKFADIKHVEAPSNS
jgi:hypothetical protein